MAFIQPLDLQTLLVNTLAGTPVIFVFVAVIAIAAMAAAFRMNNMTFLLMFTLFALFMGSWMQWWLALIIIIVGIGAYWLILRPFKT